MKRDVFTTFGAQAASVCLSFVSYGVIAKCYGEAGVGGYSIVNRFVTSYVPLLMLGTSIAVIREVGPARRSSDGFWLASLLTAVGSILISAIAAVTLLLLCFRKEVFAALSGALIFPNGDQAAFAGLIAASFCASILYIYNYAYYRGSSKFKICAAVQVFWTALPILCAAALGTRGSFRVYMWTLTCSQIALCCFMLGPTLGVICQIWQAPRLQWIKAFRLIGYIGIPRVPLFFVSSWTQMLGIYFLGLHGSTSEAARYSVAFALTRQFGTAANSFGQVLLPRLRQESSEKSRQLASQTMHYAVPWAFFLGAAGAATVPWLSVHLLSLNAEAARTGYFKAMLFIGVPGLLMYEIFRDIFDGLADYPYNTLSSVIGFLFGCITCLGLVFLGMSVPAAVFIGTGLALFASGTVSWFRLSKLLEEQVSLANRCRSACYLGLGILLALIPAGWSGWIILAGLLLTSWRPLRDVADLVSGRRLARISPQRSPSVGLIHSRN